MAIDRSDSDARQARMDAMIEEFRAAQQRRLVKRGIVMRKRTEAAQEAMACVRPPPSDKTH